MNRVATLATCIKTFLFVVGILALGSPKTYAQKPVSKITDNAIEITNYIPNLTSVLNLVTQQQSDAIWMHRNFEDIQGFDFYNVIFAESISVHDLAEVNGSSLLKACVYEELSKLNWQIVQNTYVLKSDFKVDKDSCPSLLQDNTPNGFQFEDRKHAKVGIYIEVGCDNEESVSEGLSHNEFETAKIQDFLNAGFCSKPDSRLSIKSRLDVEIGFVLDELAPDELAIAKFKFDLLGTNGDACTWMRNHENSIFTQESKNCSYEQDIVLDMSDVKIVNQKKRSLFKVDFTSSQIDFENNRMIFGEPLLLKLNHRSGAMRQRSDGSFDIRF